MILNNTLVWDVTGNRNMNACKNLWRLYHKQRCILGEISKFEFVTNFTTRRFAKMINSYEYIKSII